MKNLIILHYASDGWRWYVRDRRNYRIIAEGPHGYARRIDAMKNLRRVTGRPRLRLSRAAQHLKPERGAIFATWTVDPYLIPGASIPCGPGVSVELENGAQRDLYDD